MKMANNGVEPKTKEIKKYVYKRLRSGAVPKFLIEEIAEKYQLSESQANRIVYDCNSILNTTVEEMVQDAANYVMKNMQKVVEDALADNDRKNAIKGMELIAKVTKITDDRPNITVNANFGFDFDGGEENSDD